MTNTAIVTTRSAASSTVKALYKLPTIGAAALVYALLYFVGVNYMIDAIVFNPVVNGVNVAITIGDILICMGTLALIVEMGKAADAANGGLTDAISSIILCVVMWLGFFNLTGFASTTWLILTFMQTCDAIGGTIVGVKSSRRDYSGLVGAG